MGERVLSHARGDVPGDLSKVRSASDCFHEFQQLLLQHAQNDPRIFSLAEARSLTDYASNTFFKHFLLYQFCISTSRDACRLRLHAEVENPIAPPDLNSGRLVRNPQPADVGMERTASKNAEAKDPTATEEALTEEEE